MSNNKRSLGVSAFGALFAFSVLLTGCGGGASSSTSTVGKNSVVSNGANVVPITVDAGPTSTIQADMAYVSVTICVPGTSTCQTIDHIQVDTGSEGLRVISSLVTVGLPQQNDGSGNPIAECAQFEDGFTWGPVQMADIKIGGEQASNVPVQVIGGGGANLQSVPAACVNTGLSAEQTVDALGANGILGIGPFRQDCGTGCTTNAQNGFYFSCSASCQEVAVTLTQQLQNPVWLFPSDNNGTIVELPAVPAGGQATATGSLVFGIGTQSNNGLGSAKVLTIDNNGNFTTSFRNVPYNQSFIDSGSNGIFFLDAATVGSGLINCASPNDGFYCSSSPGATVNFAATNIGVNSTVSNVPFSIADFNSLNPNFSAFNDLGGSNPGSFDWGLPFFFGRNVFTGIEGQNSPGGVGPFFAY